MYWFFKETSSVWGGGPREDSRMYRRTKIMQRNLHLGRNLEGNKMIGGFSFTVK